MNNEIIKLSKISKKFVGANNDINSPLLIAKLTSFKTKIFLLPIENFFDIFDNLIISLFIF